MENEYVHSNTQDVVEERFSRLEEEVVDIPCNMTLLVVALANNFKPFGEVGGVGTLRFWQDHVCAMSLHYVAPRFNTCINQYSTACENQFCPTRKDL
jgi:hypothetical protein